MALVMTDLVRLKAGGPSMTVIKISADGSNAVCTWHPKPFGRLNKASFPVASLVPYPPPSMSFVRASSR